MSITTDEGQSAFTVGGMAAGAMTLPGKSEPGAGCGEWYPSEFCDECGEPHFSKSLCNQRGCPNCWRTWARQRAEGICKRLGAARYAADEGIAKRAIHATVSAPEGAVRTVEDVSEGFRTAYDLAKEKGVRGGVAMFHGYRVKKDVRKEWKRETNGGDDGLKLWAWVREHPRDWRSLAEWSPHWHILGLCEDFEADDPDAQEGWVARRIRSLESFRLTEPDGYEDMVGAAMYVMSHASFESDTSKDCVRWFGEVSTATFSPEKELSEGSWAVIERMSAEAAAVEISGDGSGEIEDDSCNNCGSESFSPIWDAGYALQDPGWCDRIGREQQHRLKTAFEWAIGDLDPPPGMKRPSTEKECLETFNELLA